MNMVTLASFTLRFQCRNHAPIRHLAVCVRVTDAERGDSLALALPSQQWSCSRSCLQHLIWGEKHCIHTRLSYRLFITLLPKKQRPSLAAEPGGSHCFHYCVVVVTVSGNFHWKEIVMVQPSLLRFQWTFPQKIASLPTSESQTGSSIYWWWLFNYVVYSKKKKKKKLHCNFPGCMVGQDLTHDIL